MGSEIDLVEERLKSFLGQLKTEYGILDRIVYKNKNQHRRCSYFQYLLKVRRDLRLLQSTKLEEILNSCFLVIHGKKPKQKVQLLESLKRRKSDDSKYNFLERLLGAARLLSQMVEPMLRAATEISKLLAQSFFMGFSLTSLALLSRFRVLIQQILLDVVCVYNIVSPLSRKKQSVKITEGGVEVFRDYYPIKEQNSISLECVWGTDKFVLVEKVNESETKSKEKCGEDVSIGASTIQYRSVEVLLGDNDNDEEQESAANISDKKSKKIGSYGHSESQSGEENRAMDSLPSAECQNTPSSSSNPLKRKADTGKKVAFFSVKVPTPSASRKLNLPAEHKVEDQTEEDPFFSLLSSGIKKSSLF
ncbi:OLC1v1022787C1 [Oldenlandia corymbosa var. corymbosa]|uniref:OLC1v1022787C1 n=1 Tax=Oldenlandia corymbosa var. corymbosa TaxID=529605 RepID=A0AAV1C0Z9_OLDCO|nr:OLC1v1022787C1 [Oldenlandia corymbosa var. corymbosa]